MASAVYSSRAFCLRRSLKDLHGHLQVKAKDGTAKRLGMTFAAFCAAATSIGPLLGIAFLALVEGEGSEVAPSAPTTPVTLIPESTGVPLARDLRKDDGLSEMTWKRLQRLEEAFAAEKPGHADATAALQAAERAHDAEQKAWAAAKAAEAAAQRLAGATSGPVVPSTSGDMTLDLGVDWAAWKAGAEIDHRHTSVGLHRGFWSRVARVVTSLVPSWRMLVTASHPPDVVLTWETGPPSRCFAFEGQSAKVSILFWHPVRPSHVALEQSPSWALDPRTSPRDFEVYVWPSGMDDPYSTRIGSFEFAGSSQVFNLTADVGLVRGLQFRFERNWGEDHTLICRVRVFGNQSG